MFVVVLNSRTSNKAFLILKAKNQSQFKQTNKLVACLAVQLPEEGKSQRLEGLWLMAVPIREKLFKYKFKGEIVTRGKTDTFLKYLVLH